MSFKKKPFEASEKKLEIILAPQALSLRDYDDGFYRKLCRKAGARILSTYSHSFCNSYVLSESSLFVWDHRLLLLTCGHTSLINALLSLLKKLRPEDVQVLFYQRKNELFPRHQKTSFGEDFHKIRTKIPGKAFCFGSPDEHHFYLFHSLAPYLPQKNDRTVEILMYDLDDSIKDIFFNSASANTIRTQLPIDKIFNNVQIDDYKFHPQGYSLNGIGINNDYYTIHVTPQNPGFYVSFETNIMQFSLEETIHKVVSLFKPVSVDVVVFSSQKLVSYSAPDFFIRSSFFGQHLECGYHVQFSSFFRPYKYPRPPFQVTTTSAIL